MLLDIFKNIVRASQSKGRKKPKKKKNNPDNFLRNTINSPKFTRCFLKIVDKKVSDDVNKEASNEVNKNYKSKTSNTSQTGRIFILIPAS